MSDDRLEVFKGGDDQFHWRKVAPNNEIVSAGEAFTRRADAIKAAKRANPECGEPVVLPHNSR